MSVTSAALATLLLLAAPASLLGAQWLNLHEADESCKGFVQSFYESYGPQFYDEQVQGPSVWPSTRSSKDFSEYDPELARQLKELFDAEVKSGTVLLDFDPVINRPRPRDMYVTGAVSHKGEHFLVDVYGVTDGRRSDQPDVVPELAYEVRRWLFVNFHYPNRTHPSSDENLLSMLKKFRKTIRQAPQSSANPSGGDR